MQYIIMFALVVMASVADIVTGILKAHITSSYDSTVMKKGLYSKVLNWFVMGATIGAEIGMTWLGQYYDCREMAAFAGTIAAGTVFHLREFCNRQSAEPACKDHREAAAEDCGDGREGRRKKLIFASKCAKMQLFSAGMKGIGKVPAKGG